MVITVTQALILVLMTIHYPVFPKMRGQWALTVTWVLCIRNPWIQGYFVTILVKIGPIVLQKKTFKVINVFSLGESLFWKRLWVFIWTNMNPLHSRMLCANLGQNWPNSSEEDLINLFNAFTLFGFYLPLEKGFDFYLNKLIKIPYPTKFSWINPVVLEKKIL